MSLTAFSVIVVIILLLGYTFYGRLIAKQLVLDDKAVTPAVQINDGTDFVPTKRFFLLAGC